MEIAPISISALALVLSVINFYWNFLRNKRHLVIVRVDNIIVMNGVDFALMNDSTQHVVLSVIECVFGSLTHDKHSSTPAQILEYKESDSRLLAPGKGLLCQIRFPEPFTASFAGIGTDGPNQMKMQTLYVHIGWVEPGGQLFDREVPLYEYGFRTDGSIGSRRPLAQTIDLNAKAKQTKKLHRI